MKPLHSISFCMFFLSLYRISNAEEQYNFNNNTISGSNLPFILSKRTTCDSQCDQCYGNGSTLCGKHTTCYDPTIGESCCALYDYSCPNGYYCAPHGQDQQCCNNRITYSACTASINNSYPANSGLSTGAKAGIGVGVAIFVLIVAGLVTCLLIRRRNRNSNPPAPAPGQWQMPELASRLPPGYSANVNYGAGPSGYDGVETKSTQKGGEGGPPVAAFYTPGSGSQRAGYNAFVPSHAEMPETPPAYGAALATEYSYPPAAQHDHVGSMERYG